MTPSSVLWPYPRVPRDSSPRELVKTIYRYSGGKGQKTAGILHIFPVATAVATGKMCKVPAVFWSFPTRIPVHRFDELPKKDVVFLTGRVHPGETGASHVINGLLLSLLSSHSPEMNDLRHRFVFKVIPMLNPDGVVSGNYRCDAKGVNLNRVFNAPCPKQHPSIFATKELIQWYHCKRHLHPSASEKSSLPPLSPPDGNCEEEEGEVKRLRKTPPLLSRRNSDSGSLRSRGHHRISRKSASFRPPTPKTTPPSPSLPSLSFRHPTTASLNKIRRNLAGEYYSESCGNRTSNPLQKHKDGGVAFYVDFHGHVSKPGCFLYGNHFQNSDEQAENLLFARLVASRAHPYFSLKNSVFSAANMKQKDKANALQGKEGSGRVAVFHATGILHCYTLECNYHGGTGEDGEKFAFTPEIYAKVGEGLLLSMLDYSSELSESLTHPTKAAGHQSFGSSTDMRSLRVWAKQTVASKRRKRSPAEKPPFGARKRTEDISKRCGGRVAVRKGDILPTNPRSSDKKPLARAARERKGSKI